MCILCYTNYIGRLPYGSRPVLLVGQVGLEPTQDNLSHLQCDAIAAWRLAYMAEREELQSDTTDANGFFLAGIYRIEQGRPVYSILTKEHVGSIAFIHNRMPVILPSEAMKDRLNPNYNGQEIVMTACSDICFCLIDYNPQQLRLDIH